MVTLTEVIEKLTAASDNIFRFHKLIITGFERVRDLLNDHGNRIEGLEDSFRALQKFKCSTDVFDGHEKRIHDLEISGKSTNTLEGSYKEINMRSAYPKNLQDRQMLLDKILELQKENNELRIRLQKPATSQHD